MEASRRIHLRTVNNLLLTAIIAVNFYIIAMPVLPTVSFWWRTQHSDQRIRLESAARSDSPKVKSQDHPNSLIVPAMLLDRPVIEGPKSASFDLLKQGIWHWPDSSTPDKGGNTVLLAHRFSYTGPRGDFYFLDKLRPGDLISLTWNNTNYRYRVKVIREVSPNEISIIAPTSDNRLTLYTCTPLWHPVNRLVVVAEKETIK